MDSNLFYANFSKGYPDVWQRITRDLAPEELSGDAPMPGRVHDRAVLFLRQRQHAEATLPAYLRERGII